MWAIRFFFFFVWLSQIHTCLFGAKKMNDEKIYFLRNISFNFISKIYIHFKKKVFENRERKTKNIQYSPKDSPIKRPKLSEWVHPLKLQQKCSPPSCPTKTSMQHRAMTPCSQSVLFTCGYRKRIKDKEDKKKKKKRI